MDRYGLGLMVGLSCFTLALVLSHQGRGGLVVGLSCCTHHPVDTALKPV